MGLKGAAFRTRDKPRGWRLEIRKDSLANSLTKVQKDSLVFMQTNGTNMPHKYMKKTMKNLTQGTLPQFPQVKSQTTTFLSEDSLAKLFQLLENAEDLMTPEERSFLKLHGFLKINSRSTLFLKT